MTEVPTISLSQGKPLTGAEFVAPARVNLLGEHTDYTGGYVLPMAIGFHTTAHITPRFDGRYGFSSERFAETAETGADDGGKGSGSWSDYPVGVLRMLQRRGIQVPGFDLRLGGNVPLGTGLSSSASVEVASAMAMLDLAGVALKAKQIALLCQKAENEFVGSPCGIMDQFVVTAATAGHAMLLDTRKLTYELLPLMAGTRIVVANSMVKHSIASGEYGQRRREVESGQRIVTAAFRHIRTLRDATLEELEFCRSEMTDESYARCRHIVSENARVLAAREAMLAGDRDGLGALMLAGHASQRDDFACSCAETDFLVEMAASISGCYGARMTGGGFGGCTISLVDESVTEAFAAELRERYLARFGVAIDTFVCEAVDGAMLRQGNQIAEDARA